jgi:hypothetical protein
MNHTPLPGEEILRAEVSNEKRFTKIIDTVKVKMWIDFGWIEIGDVSPSDIGTK